MKLSKREIILLSFLIIIAMIFVDVYLIIMPGQTHLKELTDQNDLLDIQINTINFNLSNAKNMETKRDENLVLIDELAKPYLDGVKPDSLLVFTHQMLIKHGFTPSIYTPLPVTIEIMPSEQIVVGQTSYRIKDIAEEYRQMQLPGSTTDSTTPTSTDTPTPTEPTQVNDSIDHYILQIDAIGSYEQIKALLDDFASLGRMVIISDLSMKSDPVNAGMLETTFSVNYYGIEKLVPTDDPINDWTRETIPVSSNDPFTQGSVPIETTVPVETVATIAGA